MQVYIEEWEKFQYENLVHLVRLHSDRNRTELGDLKLMKA